MGYLDYAGLQYLWGKLKEKFAPKSHSHDDRYYTEAEMDGKLNSKVNNNEAGANGLFSKLGIWTATPTDDTYFIRQDTGGGNEFGRVKFSTLWNYIKGKTDGVYQPKGSYAASGHTHDDRYYTESEMNAKLAEKSNINHTHKNVNDIGNNKPTTFAYSKSSMNYGDYSWLAGWNGYEMRAVNKNQFAITGHTHTKDQVGLGNVDNTADKDKNVKYATSAGSVTNAQCLNNDDKYMKFHWSGLDGQPTWLWGGNDSGDMYVYNPSNFNVNYATTAGSADNGVAASSVNSSGYPGYIRFNNGIQICWGVGSSGSANGSFFFPQSFLKAPCIMISGTGAYRYAFYVTNNTTRYFSYLRDGSGETSKPQYIAIGLWK